MKRTNRDHTLLITTALCLLPTLLALCVYGELSDQVPTHWNFAGEIDGWSHKAFAGFGLPLLLAALNVVVHVTLDNDPRRQNIARPIALLGKWTAPAVCLLLVPMTLLAGLGRQVPVGTLAPAFAGVLVMAVGNYMPKTRRSYTAGLRLPWTLASDENWRRTHRLAGVCFVAGGLAMVIFALLTPSIAWAGLALMLALSIVPCVYSFLLYKRGI